MLPVETTVPVMDGGGCSAALASIIPGNAAAITKIKTAMRCAI
jgi:hypothetical protein